MPEVIMRPCGECSLCCRLLRINKGDSGDFPFDKPPDADCKHLRPGHGCEIFGERLPTLCKNYFCLWKDPRMLPEGFRPDKINAICHCDPPINGHLVIRVVSDLDGPARPSDFQHWVNRLLNRGVVFVFERGGRARVVSQSEELWKAVATRLLVGRKPLRAFLICIIRLLRFPRRQWSRYFDKSSHADSLLVVDGRSWAEFAKEHQVKIWPAKPKAAERKPPLSVGADELAKSHAVPPA